MARILALFSVLICAFSASASQVPRDPAAYASLEFKKAVTLPMRDNARDLVAIDVTIDGQGPYLFGIDTCASGAGRISPELADKLGLKVSGEIRASDGTGVNARTMKLRGAHTLAIGSITFSGVDLLERGNVSPPRGQSKGPAVDGIIGFGLFKELLLKVDFVKRLVTVSGGRLDAGSNVVSMDDGAGISEVQLQLSGRTMPAHFDLGADGGIVVPAAEAKELKFDGEPKTVAIAKTNFNEIELKGGRILGDAVIGPLKLSNPVVTYAEIFRRANFGRKSMLGHAFTFDRATKRMRID